MNAAHTPGPWKVDPNFWGDIETAKGELQICTVDADGDVGHNFACPEIAEAEANARLIAASPDLLEALERLVDRVTDLGANGFSQEVANGKAAIAKAKGGQGE